MEVIFINQKKSYGLSTATAMIVGICIGSGIFFKVDDILMFTGGNVYLGALVFVIGAFSIIFGSITLTNLAARSSKNGGIVAYFEEFYSEKIASAVGWFQTFLYYPTIAVVVAWASGIYTCLLLNLPDNLDLQMSIGLLYLLLFYSINIISSTLGGRFQVLSSIAKLIPLIGVGIIALFFTGSHPDIPQNVEPVPLTNVGLGWLAALAPTAFSYDGWAISLSISGEVKNSKKTMPIALIIAPIIVLFVYLAYFLGMTHILGPEYILATGNGAVTEIGQMLLGKSGEIIILLFILISMLGVVNGVVLGHIRMPYALATKKMIPYSEQVAKNNRGFLTNYSALISLGCSLFWFLIHYLTQKFTLMSTGDISEIAIVFGYLLYMLLYIKVLMLYKQKVVTNTFTGLIAPILAMIGGLIIVIGGFSSNPKSMMIFFLICFIFSFAGYSYYKKKTIQ
ncbi:MAG: APC family permease [Vagococcus sp.]|jgi:APA family basic amino acid/polyamine antiporter|nr:APC family permease [Vagococcus sp.]